jgi:hypothetical protein
MFKFISNKILDWKLKSVPVEQRAMIKAIMEKNPKLFETIAKETEAKKKAGVNEQAAALQVFFAHKNEIAQAMREAGMGPQQPR